MVVVAIIAVASGLALPSVRLAMANRWLQQDSITLLNVYRDARFRAMMRGQAQLVRATLNAGASAPTLEVIEGATSSCTNSLGTFASVYENPRDFTSYPRLVARVTGGGAPGGTLNPDTIARVSNLNVLDMCYAPSGRAWYRTDVGQPYTNSNTNAFGFGGGFNYLVYFQTGSSWQNVARRNFFLPFNGMPHFGGHG